MATQETVTCVWTCDRCARQQKTGGCNEPPVGWIEIKSMIHGTHPKDRGEFCAECSLAFELWLKPKDAVAPLDIPEGA